MRARARLTVSTYSPTAPNRWRRCLVGIVLAACSACGAPPDLEAELSTVHSWTATAQLAAADLRSRALSHQMADQLHERSVKARQEVVTSLASSAHSDGDRRRARAAVDSLDTAIRALRAQQAPR